MLNGQKAYMKTDELVKAAILSKASRTIGRQPESANHQSSLNDLLQIIKDKVGEEWEINALRSRYAREWDKWMYWWNKPEVIDFYGSGSNPMGLLLEYYFYLHYLKYSNDPKRVPSIFKQFADKLNKNHQSEHDTNVTFKKEFKKIRDLQKTFEDWFEDPVKYNYLGMILKTAESKKNERR